MRKRPTIQPRNCVMCGEAFTPSNYVQKYCPTCKAIADKRRKMEYYDRKFPDRKPKTKSSEVCCVCGAPFSSHYDGKPYCNKHYLRMKVNGTPEYVGRKRTNTYDVQGDTTIVTTKSGRTFTVDTADLEQVKRHSWCFSKTGYLVANIDHRVMKLHRYLLQPDDGVIVDHINGDPSDNRRCNLRFCSDAENARNTSASKTSRSGILGVRRVESGKYSARIMVNRKEIRLGLFDTLEEAVAARENAERLYFKEFSPSISRTVTTVSGTME